MAGDVPGEPAVPEGRVGLRWAGAPCRRPRRRPPSREQLAGDGDAAKRGSRPVVHDRTAHRPGDDVAADLPLSMPAAFALEDKDIGARGVALIAPARSAGLSSSPLDAGAAPVAGHIYGHVQSHAPAFRGHAVGGRFPSIRRSPGLTAGVRPGAAPLPRSCAASVKVAAIAWRRPVAERAASDAAPASRIRAIRCAPPGP